MKKIEIVIFSLFIGFSLHSQTLNPTQSIISPGTADSFKGGYTFSYATAGTPWNGALISFGGLDNRYDCQISADYGVNGSNRISFRTRNGDVNNGVGTWNSWNELATKGANNFIGNQIINGNVGIGTQNPDSKLTVEGNINARSITINSGLNNTLSRPPLTSGTSEYGEIRAYSMHGNSMDDGFLRICAGGGTTQWAKTYIDISGYSTVPDMDRNIVFGTSSLERMRIMDSGNVGIGTSAPDSKLTVAGNIHAQEVKVTLRAGEVPDYVFAIDYKLKSLNEVEQYIRENSHLPEIPSAQEIEKNGLMMAEMNMNLLKKIEELTLYMIEIKKENLEMKKKQVELEKQVKNLSSQ